ncbi:MAG: hypothetical protein ACR2MP_22635 [Streptosporangiaceae bacterium]
MSATDNGTEYVCIEHQENPGGAVFTAVDGTWRLEHTRDRTAARQFTSLRLALEAIAPTLATTTV